jgi:exonuclease VII large subunit
MSRRLGLRLVPDRVVDERDDTPSDADELSVEQLDQIARRAARDKREILDQPPALGATPAATPSG